MLPPVIFDALCGSLEVEIYGKTKDYHNMYIKLPILKFVPRRFGLALVFYQKAKTIIIGEALSFNFPITTIAKPNLLGTNFKMGSIIYYNSLWVKPFRYNIQLLT